MTGSRSFWKMGNDFLYHLEDADRENAFDIVEPQEKLLHKKVTKKNFIFISLSQFYMKKLKRWASD